MRIQFDLNSALLHFQPFKVSLDVPLQGLSLNIFILRLLVICFAQLTKVRGISLLYRLSSSPWANRAGLPTREGSVLPAVSQLRQAEALGYLSTQLARQGDTP